MADASHPCFLVSLLVLVIRHHHVLAVLLGDHLMPQKVSEKKLGNLICFCSIFFLPILLTDEFHCDDVSFGHKLCCNFELWIHICPLCRVDDFSPVCWLFLVQKASFLVARRVVNYNQKLNPIQLFNNTTLQYKG